MSSRTQRTGCRHIQRHHHHHHAKENCLASDREKLLSSAEHHRSSFSRSTIQVENHDEGQAYVDEKGEINKILFEYYKER
mmetsp:Transcript_38578/g.97119  ORF Transcript_38578/g.97119 Transcript_38578/m.97119 type:complete len:80 (+) Transcript_38578:166-405(+)